MEMNLARLQRSPEDADASCSMVKIARIAICIISAIFLQAIVIHRLDTHGILDKLIPWDECAYIYMGITNAVSISNGAWDSLEFFHSPLTIVPATISAMIAPKSVVMPYAVNFVYLSALFIFVDRTLKGRSFLSVVTFIVLLITTPYIFIFTSHVKADFLGGIAIFALLTYLFDNTEDDGRNKKGIIFPAAMSILVLFSKPMAFYLPILLLASFTISAVIRLITDNRIYWRSIISYHIALALFTLFVYAFLVITNFTFFKWYILQALSPMWSTQLSTGEKLLYYLPFVNPEKPEGVDFWGRNYLSFAAIGLTFVFSLNLTRGRKRILLAVIGLFLVACVAYIPITVSPQIQWAFGSFFAGSVMAVVFRMFCAIQASPRIAAVSNLSIIIATAFVFEIPARTIEPRIPSDQRSLDQSRAVVDDFVAKMNPDAQGNPKNPPVLFPFNGLIPGPDFSIRYYRKYGELPGFFAEPFVVDRDFVEKEVGRYKYVVMFGDGRKLIPFTDSNRNLAQTQRQIDDMWNLQEVSKMPYDGTYYALYRVVSRK